MEYPEFYTEPPIQLVHLDANNVIVYHYDPHG